MFCNELLKRNKDIKIVFINVLALTNHVKQTFDRNPFSKFDTQKLIRKAIEADLFVLDDLGKEKFQNWIHIEILYSIISARIHDKKSNIILSSLSVPELNNYYKRMNPNEYNNILTFCKKLFYLKKLKNNN